MNKTKTKMRKIFTLILGVAILLMIAACGGPDAGNAGNPDNNIPGPGSSDGGNTNGNSDGNDTNPGSNLDGTSEEILQQILDAISAAGVETPMALPPLAPAPDLVQYDIGLSEADFNRLAVSAASSVAAIGTFAHQIIIIEAKSPAMASEIKTLVSGDNGYDAKKWICVFPDLVIAVESGNYVLVAASTNEIVGAAKNAFEGVAGNIGTVITFWDFANEDVDVDIGFGGGGGLEIIP